MGHFIESSSIVTSLMLSYRTVYVIFGFSNRLSIVLTAPIFLKQLTKDFIPSLMRYLSKTFLCCGSFILH